MSKSEKQSCAPDLYRIVEPMRAVKYFSIV